MPKGPPCRKQTFPRGQRHDKRSFQPGSFEDGQRHILFRQPQAFGERMMRSQGNLPLRQLPEVVESSQGQATQLCLGIPLPKCQGWHTGFGSLLLMGRSGSGSPDETLSFLFAKFRSSGKALIAHHLFPDSVSQPANLMVRRRSLPDSVCADPIAPPEFVHPSPPFRAENLAQDPRHSAPRPVTGCSHLSPAQFCGKNLDTSLAERHRCPDTTPPWRCLGPRRTRSPTLGKVQQAIRW